MKVYNLRFQVEIEDGDQEPNGTADQMAAQIFNAIRQRELNTFRVRSLEVNVDGRRVFTVEALGTEIFG